MVKIKSTVAYSACQYVLTSHWDVFLDSMGILQLARSLITVLPSSALKTS